MKKNTQAILLALAAVLSWSTVATAFKVALTYLTHFEMLLIASLTSVLIFAIVLTFQKKWTLVKQLTVKQWKELAFQGFLNPAAYYLILFKAYDMLPAQVAQPVNYAWPIVLLILLAIFAKQPIPSKKYIGMVISMSGVVMISLGTGQLSGMSVPVQGVLLAALSAFFWAAYWMVNNKNKHSVDAIVSLFGSFVCGSLYLITSIPVFGLSLPSLNGCGLVVVLELIGCPPNSVLRGVVHNDELILRRTSGVDTGHNVNCAELGELTLLIALESGIGLSREKLLV